MQSLVAHLTPKPRRRTPGTYLQSIGGTLVQRFNVIGLVLLLRLLLGLGRLSARGEGLRLRGRDSSRAGQDGRARRRRRRQRRPVRRRRRRRCHCRRCRRDTGRGNVDSALILRCHRRALS